MKKISNITLALVVLFTFFTGIGSSHAQGDFTIYGMKSLPQRTYANPALRPDSRFFIGIPGLSSLYGTFNNSSFEFDEFTSALERKNADTVILNINALSNMFRDNNSFSGEMKLDLIHFGFQAGPGNYFTFNSTLVHKSKLSFDADLPKLILEGNGGRNLGKRFDLGFDMDLLDYVEFGLGYSRSLMDQRLTVGARVKYLKGLVNVTTEQSDMYFTTDPNDYTLLLQSNIRLNTASSIGNIEADTFGDNVELSDILGLASNNGGWGLDVGATFELNKKIELSAAIRDMGRIKWNDNVKNYYSRDPNAKFEFKGLDFNTAFEDTDSTDVLEALADSIADRFKLDEANQSYTTGLSPEFYLGGTFSFTKNHRAGVLFYGDWYHQRLHPAFTLSWYSQFTRVVALSATYTIMNNKFNNFGIGLSLNGGPFQYYFVTDNVVSLFSPNVVRNFSFRTGMSFTFLRNPKDKKKYERK